MWTYAQATGDLLQNGKKVGTGYSGFDNGKNNPAMQSVENVGPIPQGEWIISGPPFNSPDHGPFVLHLTPVDPNQSFGRSAFLMHGDSIKSPGNASRGCIIMPRVIREQVWNSNDTDLEVVAEFATQDISSATPA